MSVLCRERRRSRSKPKDEVKREVSPQEEKNGVKEEEPENGDRTENGHSEGTIFILLLLLLFNSKDFNLKYNRNIGY